MNPFLPDSRGPGPSILGADGSQAELITAVFQKWGDGFGGDTMSAEKWERVDLAGGAAFTAAVAGSALTVTAPAEVGEMWLLSKAMFTVPFDVMAVLREAACDANRVLDVDVIEVDPNTGTPLANGFLADEARSRAGLRWNSATVNAHRLAALGSQSPAEASVAIGSAPSRTAFLDAWLTYRADDTWLSFAISDSVAAKSGAAGRISSQVPSPNGTFRLRLRFRTLVAGVPGTWTIGRILVIDGQEIPVQIRSGAGDALAGNAMPVNLASNPAVAGTVGAGSTTGNNPVVTAGRDSAGTVRAMLTDALGGQLTKGERPTLNADVASAARTTSGNSGTIASAGGQTIAGAVKVTAAGGTTPVLDVWLEESFNEVDFVKVYDVGRFTGTGRIDIPPMQMSGRRRWAWSIAGSGATFTFGIDVMEGSGGNAPIVRQEINRSINLNTLNSASAGINVEGCSKLNLYLLEGAAGSAPPTISVDLSPDGVNYYSALSFQPGALAELRNLSSFVAKFARTRVLAAGTGATLVSATLSASE